VVAGVACAQLAVSLQIGPCAEARKATFEHYGLRANAKD
jgi:hypothetical protein